MQDANAIWIASLVAAALIMVLSMIQFNAALIAPARAPGRLQPVGLDQLVTALLALNTPRQTFRLTPLSERELRLEWDGLTSAERAAAARVHSPFSYHARLLAFEPAHEVRCLESVRTSGKVGGQGANVQWQWGAVQANYVGHADVEGTHGTHRQVRVQLDTTAITSSIARIARENGWQYRPVALPFQATAKTAVWIDKLTPGFARSLGASRTWGGVYVLAWVWIVGLLVTHMPRTFASFAALAGIVGAFVVIQLMVVWVWRRGSLSGVEVE